MENSNINPVLVLQLLLNAEGATIQRAIDLSTVDSNQETSNDNDCIAHQSVTSLLRRP